MKQAQSQDAPQAQATATLALQPFNNVSIGATTPTQLTAPSGHWNITFVATAAGVFVKNASTVSSTDPASFPLPANVPVTLVIYGPTGIWVESAAAATLGVLLTPRGQ